MTRCGFVAIVGAPNAGKSTLLNRLTGAKLSIVSPKAQTTRFRVLGILMRGESQILLVDTPGIFKPKRRLDRAMVNAAWTGAQDADLVMLLVDAKAGLTTAVREIAQRLATRGAAAPGSQKLWLVLNKTDLVPPAALLPLIAAMNEIAPFVETFMVSATTADGLAPLMDALAAAVTKAPGSTPKTTSPTCPTACSPPKSCANKSSCKPTKKSPTPPPSKPNPSSNAPTAPCASKPPSTSPAPTTKPS